MHTMSNSLRSPSPVQAVRPTCHWWLRPRVLAWFRVLMVVSLVKPPASAGALSRIGDYLLAARGPGLCRWRRRRTTFAREHPATRDPPHLLFHRRRGSDSRYGTRDRRLLPELALPECLFATNHYDRARRIAAIVSAYSCRDNTFGACACSQIGRCGFGSQP